MSDEKLLEPPSEAEVADAIASLNLVFRDGAMVVRRLAMQRDMLVEGDAWLSPGEPPKVDDYVWARSTREGRTRVDIGFYDGDWCDDAGNPIDGNVTGWKPIRRPKP